MTVFQIAKLAKHLEKTRMIWQNYCPPPPVAGTSSGLNSGLNCSRLATVPVLTGSAVFKRFPIFTRYVIIHTNITAINSIVYCLITQAHIT